MRGLRLLIIGKQGSGKGTLCVQFAQHFGVPHISTGDAFRAAVAESSERGIRAKAFMESGQLVPDDLVMEIVDELFVRESLRERGFLFDGFPRTVHQADLLDATLAPEGVDAVIDLEVSTEVVVARLASRRVCSNPNCGAIYSLKSPPKSPWNCDLCGSPVVQRDDDREEMIRRRLDDYEAMTAPLVDRYEALGKLIRVDAALSPDEVFSRALAELLTRRLANETGEA